MIKGFNLIHNLNLSWLKQNFSRGYKLLHVFWNTLYVACKLICWLVVLRIYDTLAVFQPYRDLEVGDDQYLKPKRRDWEWFPDLFLRKLRNKILM